VATQTDPLSKPTHFQSKIVILNYIGVCHYYQ